MTRIELEATAGTTIFASTGMLGRGHPDRMSVLNFYKAMRGSRVSLLNKEYYFNIATYSLNFDEKYIYSYCYQEEQNWTTYNHDLSGTTYRQEDYVFDEEVYFRICLKRIDGKNFTDEEAESINKIVMFETAEMEEYKERVWFSEEIQKTVDIIQKKRKENSLVLGVLTDTHITVNGTWEDTVYNIKAVHQKVGFDAIVHMGDLTDGMVPAKVTKKNVEKVIDDLRKNQVPLYVVVGNHDTNYFFNNCEPMSDEEIYNIYQRHSDVVVKREQKNLYYFVDYKNLSIRCLFLTSFDFREEIRYGFSDEELRWVQNTLKHTPSGYSIVVFSHDAPLPELDFWSDTIRNGEKLMAILETYGMANGKKILAFVHGHTHADYVYTKRAFPIVSVGCAKCEYFTDKKPEGSLTPERRLNTVTQDLWDTMIILPAENRIDFIRFGAGEDRTVYC